MALAGGETVMHPLSRDVPRMVTLGSWGSSRFTIQLNVVASRDNPGISKVPALKRPLGSISASMLVVITGVTLGADTPN